MNSVLTHEPSATTEQIAEIIRIELEAQQFGMADALRSAAMYCPLTMAPKQWVEACIKCGVHPGTARNRLNEVRHQQRELIEAGLTP